MTPYLSRNDVMQRYHLKSAATIYRWMRDIGFPRPVKFGRRSLWLVTDIEAFDKRQLESEGRHGH